MDTRPRTLWRSISYSAEGAAQGAAGLRSGRSTVRGLRMLLENAKRACPGPQPGSGDGADMAVAGADCALEARVLGRAMVSAAEQPGRDTPRRQAELQAGQRGRS